MAISFLYAKGAKFHWFQTPKTVVLINNNITVIGLDWVGLDYEFHEKYERRGLNYSRRDQVSFLLLQDGENP